MTPDPRSSRRTEAVQDPPDRRPTLGCPLCRRDVAEDKLLGPGSLGRQLVAVVRVNTPGWEPEMGLCRECAERFESAREFLEAHRVRVEEAGVPILPTPLRMGALEEYRGRGVTIAFLDAGFYAHPDLVEPRDRIARYVDILNRRRRREDLDTPEDSSWHGMMTSVVACGNGHLSDGFYRGVASEARVVLVKVGNVSRVAHDDIRR